jgi:hypothetical protein
MAAQFLPQPNGSAQNEPGMFVGPHKKLNAQESAYALAQQLADPEWHPSAAEHAAAQHALAQAPSCPQQPLPLK